MINDNQRMTSSQSLALHESPPRKPRNSSNDVIGTDATPRRMVQSFKIKGFDNNEVVLQLISKYNHNHQPSSSTMERTLGASPRKDRGDRMDSSRRNLKVTFVDQITEDQPLTTIVEVESYKRYYSNPEDGRPSTSKAAIDCCSCLIF